MNLRDNSQPSRMLLRYTVVSFLILQYNSILSFSVLHLILFLSVLLAKIIKRIALYSFDDDASSSSISKTSFVSSYFTTSKQDCMW